MLARYGWQNLLTALGLAGAFGLSRRPGGITPAPVQVRETLECLGPTFIKFGQLLSTHPELIPPDYIKELEKLQDRLPEISYVAVRKIIQEEFGSDVCEVFSSFNETPIGAASLGQAHLARLKEDDREVVVKVQRPAIRPMIDNDLEILSSVAHFLEQRFESLRSYMLVDLIEEFAINLHQEMDYTREGRNGDLLRQSFIDIPYAKFANILWDYSTSRVLTMERLSGVKITDIDELKRRGYDLKEVARNLSRIFLKMVFIDGVFHGDPHPGNIVVMDNNVVALFDYGVVGRIDKDLKTKITMLVQNFIHEDSAGFTEILLAMGSWPASLDRKAFGNSIDRLLRQYYGAPLREVKVGEAVTQAVRISALHHISLPPSLGLLGKVMLGVEGIDNLLDPDYDFTSEARPFVVRAMLGEFSFDSLKYDIPESMLNWKGLLRDFPHRSSQVLERIADGNLRSILKLEGFDNAVKDLDKSANRLSFALIATGIIVGSAQIISNKVGPLWHGFSVIGVAGFAVAFIFGLWLLLSIIRAGNLW